jgi:hypothetical protein
MFPMPNQRPRCPEQSHAGQCMHPERHHGSCETTPAPDCKHGFMWWPENPVVPFTVAENAAFHGITF